MKMILKTKYFAFSNCFAEIQCKFYRTFLKRCFINEISGNYFEKQILKWSRRVSANIFYVHVSIIQREYQHCTDQTFT